MPWKKKFKARQRRSENFRSRFLNIFVTKWDPKFNALEEFKKGTPAGFKIASAFEAKYPNVMENAKKYPYMPF